MLDMLPFVLPKSAALLSVTSRSILNIFGSCCSVVEIFHHLGFCAVSADSSLPAFYALTLHKIFEVNPLNPVVVLVPSSLSRQQSGLGTSTNTIFINFLKKSIGSIGFRFVPLDPSMFLVSATMISFFPTLIHALWLWL